MVIRKNSVIWVSLFLLAIPLFGQGQSAPKAKPRVIVVGVNGMELDIIRPLILKGQMTNLASVIEKGAYGKQRNVSAPNCPRVYSTVFSRHDPNEHGATCFVLGVDTSLSNQINEEHF